MCVKRRILSLLCAAALLLSLAVPALGAEAKAAPGSTITEGDVTGKVNPDRESVTITKITYTPSNPARYELPSALGGLPVTGLGPHIFSGPGGYNMTSLAIPASVTTIDPDFIYFSAENPFIAFEVAAENLNYKSADGVLYTKDGTELFAFPKGRAGTFAVPGTVKRIGTYAFYSSRLNGVTLPSGLESIGDYAFQTVSNLTELVIPDSVTTLGKGIVNGCFYLTTLKLPGGLETVPAGLASNTGLTTLVLGEGTKAIDTGAFSSCGSLTAVTLPSTLTTIGEEAFRSCDGLTAIAFPNSLTTIGPSAFSYCSRLANIAWGTGLTSIGKEAFHDTGFGDDDLKALPASVTSLGNNAFNSTKITKVTAETLPASLTALPDGLFSSCELLTTVSLPNTVTTMGAGVFSHCAALTNVTLPGSLSEIPDHTFNTCEALSSVIIPASVTRIGAGAFSSNYMLTEIALPAGLTTLGDGAFQSCRGLKSIAIPAGVTELPVNAFSHCWALGSVTLSEGLTTVHHYAFEHCTSLGEIAFPESLTNLSRLTFMYNPVLSRVTFLGDRPTTKDSSSSSESNPFGGVVASGLKVYYPTGDASYDLWKGAPYSEKFTLVPGLPTDPPKEPAGIALTASLARMPQKNLLLWLTTAVTPTTGHTSDSKLLPTGAITAYFNGTALASPVYFVSGGNSLSRTFGYDVTNLIDTASLTVKVALADSLGFTGTFSNELTGTVTNHQSQDWLPFGTGSSDPIINTEYGWRPGEEGKGVVLTSLPSNLLPATKSRAAEPTTVVTLPNRLNDADVTGLGASLFSGTAVTEVVIPDTVTTIEAGVFQNCEGLTSITLPAALKTIGADAFQGSALTGVTFLGMTAPTLAEGNNPFPKGAILHMQPGATGFDGGVWDEAKQVALGITFPDFYTEDRFTVGPEIGKMTLNLPNLFDTSAYPGETAPALDPSKLTVELTDAYNKVIPATFTLSGDILQVQIPPTLFDTRIHLTVSYSGDGNYTAVTAWTGGTGTTPFPVPVQKIPLAITKVDAAVKKDETDKLCLYLTPAFNPPNYYGQSGTEPYLVLLHVMLNDKEVTVTSTKDSPTVKAAIPDDLIGKDVKVEVLLQGTSVHFQTPTNTVTLEKVYLSDTPKPEPTLSGITLSEDAITLTDKTPRQLTATLAPAGITADIAWESDHPEIATVSTTGLVTAVANGAATITAKAGSFSDTCAVTVNIPKPPDPVPTLSDIAVTTPPTKTTYTVGDTLETAGIEITANYDGKPSEVVSSGYTFSPTGVLNTAGTVTITVTYLEKTATFTVTVNPKPVIPPTLTGIRVTTPPTKTTYTVGDSLDTAGMVVTATYSDESTKILTDQEYVLIDLPGAFGTAGTETITVTYEGKTATFDVTVNENTAPPKPDPVALGIDFPALDSVLSKNYFSFGTEPTDMTLDLPILFDTSAYPGETAPAPDLSKVTVRLDNRNVVGPFSTTEDILHIPVDPKLFGRKVNLSVRYPGDEIYGSAESFVSGSGAPADIANIPIRRFPLAITNVTHEAKIVTATSNGKDYLHLLLTSTFDPPNYYGLANTAPRMTWLEVTVDGEAVNKSYTDGNPTVDVTILKDLYGKTVPVTLTYNPPRGDDTLHFGTSNVYRLTVTFPQRTPVVTPDPPSGGGSSAPKPAGGTDVKVTVSSKDATQAVKDAASDGGSVILKAKAGESAKSVAVTVPASVMKAVAKAEAPISIQSPVADLTLDLKVLESLRENGVKDVVVSAGAADSAALPKAAREVLSDRPVYDINITSGGKSVSQFGGGTVTVALPYTLAPGENPACLTACWVKEDGTTEVLRSSVYRDGKLTFRTSHLSTYAIIHTDLSFPDVTEGNWGKADIDFVVSRGMLKGVGDNGAGAELFGPDLPLTGSMAVVALARMDGVADRAPAPDGTPHPNWAAPAFDWAEEKGILPVGFRADAPLTREQFAYLVAGFLGGAEEVSTPAYLDISQATLACTDSIYYLYSLGIMRGTGDGYFNPHLTLTRSELAAVLHRLALQEHQP